MSTYLAVLIIGAAGGLLAGYRLGVRRALRHLGNDEFRKRMATVQRERESSRLPF